VTAGIEEATGTPRPDPGAQGATVAGTRFAHASEAEMARILDFYAVRWQYEPMTFPILWNTDGDVVESFSPDFYLPDLELFLEMTTLKQRLVRKKNRKLRRLRELYPDNEVLANAGDETRLIVSEPLGDLPGAWNEVPESSAGVVRPGTDELVPFRPVA